MPNQTSTQLLSGHVKLLLVVLILVGVMYHQSEAAVYTKILDAHKDHPGKCYRKEDNEAHEVGSVWTRRGICEEHTCSKAPRGKFTIDTRGCGVAAVDPPCKIVKDPTRPYPDCCPRIECP